MKGLTGMKGANAGACESWRKREEGAAGGHDNARKAGRMSIEVRLKDKFSRTLFHDHQGITSVDLW